MSDAVPRVAGAEPDPREESLALGNLCLELESYRVSIDEERLDFTHHEFELLRLFCQQPDRIIPYDALCQQLFGTSGRSAVRHLSVLVHHLRVKLTGMEPYVIETVRGRGYGLLEAFPRRRQNHPRAGP